MSWDDKEQKATNQEAAPTPTNTEGEAKAADAQAGQQAAASPEATATAAASSDAKAADTTVAPEQKAATDATGEIVGRVAKRIREKAKEQISGYKSKVEALQAELEALKGAKAQQDDLPPIIEDEPAKNANGLPAERALFLEKQDKIGRAKYGQQFQDALDIIGQAQDPRLIERIQWSVDPVESVIAEAKRLAQDLELGETPEQRERALRAQIEKEVRAKLEAENKQRLTAMGKQPTDVQHLRAAGGDETPKRTDSWADVLPR